MIPARGMGLGRNILTRQIVLLYYKLHAIKVQLALTLKDFDCRTHFRVLDFLEDRCSTVHGSCLLRGNVVQLYKIFYAFEVLGPFLTLQ